MPHHRKRRKRRKSDSSNSYNNHQLVARQAMKVMNHIVRLSLIVALGFSLTLASFGCQGDNVGKPDPIVTKKIAAPPASLPKPAVAKKTPGAVASPAGPPPAVQPPYKVARLPYDPTGKVDPFRPLFKEDPKPKKDQPQTAKKPERPRTPLERLDLGQLQLTAIVFSEVRPRALVEEDNGKGYVVQIGTPIGLERGQVTEIRKDRLVIEHPKTDDFGNTSTRRRELKLQKPLGD
jgi:type IV pilus assembly protein PilP